MCEHGDQFVIIVKFIIKKGFINGEMFYMW